MKKWPWIMQKACSENKRFGTDILRSLGEGQEKWCWTSNYHENLTYYSSLFFTSISKTKIIRTNTKPTISRWFGNRLQGVKVPLCILLLFLLLSSPLHHPAKSCHPTQLLHALWQRLPCLRHTDWAPFFACDHVSLLKLSSPSSTLCRFAVSCTVISRRSK